MRKVVANKLLTAQHNIWRLRTNKITIDKTSKYSTHAALFIHFTLKAPFTITAIQLIGQILWLCSIFTRFFASVAKARDKKERLRKGGGAQTRREKLKRENKFPIPRVFCTQWTNLSQDPNFISCVDVIIGLATFDTFLSDAIFISPSFLRS